jgi:ketosteroid isomerase-like protein
MSTTNDPVVEELLQLEQRRCDAVAAGDETTLRELLSPTLIHVHTRGNQDSLESYLEYLARTIEILRVQRRDLKVQVHDRFAVMTGHQTNTARQRGTDTEPIQVESQVMQVWAKTDSGWHQLAFQATPLGAAPPAVPRASSS